MSDNLPDLIAKFIDNDPSMGRLSDVPRGSVRGQMINEEKLSQLLGDGKVDGKNKKSGKGAHGGGNSYKQLEGSKEFEDHTKKKSFKKKDKPGDSTENKMDPGEGEKGSKPDKPATPKGFKSSKDKLPSKKDKPGKSKENRMEESKDKSFGVLLEMALDYADEAMSKMCPFCKGTDTVPAGGTGIAFYCNGCNQKFIPDDYDHGMNDTETMELDRTETMDFGMPGSENFRY